MFKKKRLAIINQNKLQIQFCVARWVVIFSQWIFLYGAARSLCFAGIHFELLWLSGTSKRMRNTQRRIYSPTKLTFKHSWIQLRSSLDKHMITFSPLLPFSLVPPISSFSFFSFPPFFFFSAKSWYSYSSIFHICIVFSPTDGNNWSPIGRHVEVRTRFSQSWID